MEHDMTTEKTAADLAGILARGFDLHVQAHGPDGSHALRTASDDRYDVRPTATGATSFVEYDGQRFAVNVTLLPSGQPY
jgi:hypothetical protein